MNKCLIFLALLSSCSAYQPPYTPNSSLLKDDYQGCVDGTNASFPDPLSNNLFVALSNIGNGLIGSRREMTDNCMTGKGYTKY